MSFSEASWTGLFNFRKGEWDSYLLQLVGMDEQKMPPVMDSTNSFEGLCPRYAKKWPELHHVSFFLGIIDGAAANVGSKCLNNR